MNTCGRYCSRVHHVQTESDLRAEWFHDADTVGITAGTSTPDAVIDRIERRIRELGAPPARPGRRNAVETAPMTRLSSRARTRWLIVVVFAVGMAWVEAASVYYLRVLVDRIEPYQANPLPIRGVLGQVELVREAATLVMLADARHARRADVAQRGWATRRSRSASGTFSTTSFCA